MHFTEQTAQKLLRGELSADEKIAVLQEAALCEECAAILAKAVEGETLIPVPWGFAESTLLSVNLKSEPEMMPHKSESLFLYAVKVTAAMCAALALVFSGITNHTDKINFDGIKDKTSWVGQQLEDGLKTLSEKRYNNYLEEYGYANKNTR